VNKILLDTNAYTAFLRGSYQVLDALGQAEIVFVSIIVLGELEAGFKGGSKEEINRDLLRRFLAKPSVRVLNATFPTAMIFGRIKSELKHAGTPLPINDVWIAAHAIETEATLISYDNHFKKISSLMCWPVISGNHSGNPRC